MYKVFTIPKRNGIFRKIEAPCEDLKLRQRESLYLLMKYFKASPFAHGFVPYKNIVTMAMSHVGKEWVMSFDIEDFFPSIKYDYFKKIVPDSYKVPDIHFYDFGDGKGMRLPQGAPGSPFLSNLYLKSFDWRMAWICYRLDCDYSRYADDIVISGRSKSILINILRIAENTLRWYGLKINKNKIRFMNKKRRQLVCGVVVNKKINLKRKWRKNLRAAVFQQKVDGLSSKTLGRLAFQKMVLDNKKSSYCSSDICRSICLSRKLSGL